jgi:nucleotidyltransferase substrate binding protein (TIGR01987 family)
MIEENEPDLTKLKNTLQTLEDGIEEYTSHSEGPKRLSNALRSGVIQNFEITYELSWKLMKRWLEANISPNIVLGVHRREFYRIAQQEGLIDNPPEWWKFHEARNKTTHIYHELIAQKLFEAALEFPPHARKLLDKLEASNGSHN